MTTATTTVKDLPKATHMGEVDIAGTKICCAVLADGRRLLGQADFFRAIGRTGKPKAAENSSSESSFKPPVFLDADNLKPFIGTDLQSPSSVVAFRTLNGQRSFGYEARLLPLVCEVYLAARRADVLTHRQVHVAEACEILVRGLAINGIIGLIDEATGFQEVRDRRALQSILDRYLRREFAAWAKRFPDEFYKQMFRLKGWKWTHMNPAGGPRCVAQMTKDIVYSRIGSGVLEELETRNPVGDNGRRSAAHHQWLTEDIGCPSLTQHLHAVVAIMRASPDYECFYRLLDRAFPKRGHAIQLDFEDVEPLAAT